MKTRMPKGMTGYLQREALAQVAMSLTTLRRALMVLAMGFLVGHNPDVEAQDGTQKNAG